MSRDIEQVKERVRSIINATELPTDRVSWFSELTRADLEFLLEALDTGLFFEDDFTGGNNRGPDGEFVWKRGEAK